MTSHEKEKEKTEYDQLDQKQKDKEWEQHLQDLMDSLEDEVCH